MAGSGFGVPPGAFYSMEKLQKLRTAYHELSEEFGYVRWDESQTAILVDQVVVSPVKNGFVVSDGRSKVLAHLNSLEQLQQYFRWTNPANPKELLREVEKWEDTITLEQCQKLNSSLESSLPLTALQL